ncbi:kinase domain protein [Aspergillus campestris IBT 28561]|uniref:non-specific serine/threonine protein kinase n=1 Tax=Aspergillus campestris (strain IBT 28561) TaxID=1392248 RepID=A0A2I1D0I6_ASPC2|nr:kinase domain protein [Aspergillus campestris IBT 28561]PKY03384.1 kinase domain protein [Aspergillus campestris IBT 28561]
MPRARAMFSRLKPLITRHPTTTHSRCMAKEETLPFYKPDQFYPVHTGELLHATYQVIGKLGYGAYSTVWLCHDQRNRIHVAAKVLTAAFSGQKSREVEVYQHLSRLGRSHVGSASIRGLYDMFDISGPDGLHRCLVQMSMHALRMRAGSGKLNIKASNIMLSIDDETILSNFERTEAEHPSPRKTVDANRTIYVSRKLPSPKRDRWGQPVLCDLGEARIGKLHRGDIQPNIYKAPEVLFDMPWSFSADIWIVGVMIWDIFENKHLFNALDEDRDYSPSHHVAEMVAYLGVPPLHFLQRSEETRNVFDEKGQWLGAGGVSVPSISLEESEENLEGPNKQLFLQFLRSMLRWVPEERKLQRNYWTTLG